METFVLWNNTYAFNISYERNTMSITKQFKNNKPKRIQWYKYTSREELEEAKDQFIQDLKDREEQKQKYKQERKIARQIEMEKLKEQYIVGAILVNSRGREQTNVDAYKIIDRKGITLTLQKIWLKSAWATSGMSEDVQPDDIKLIGEPYTKRICFNMFECGGCNLRDGKRSYHSSWRG